MCTRNGMIWGSPLDYAKKKRPRRPGTKRTKSFVPTVLVYFLSPLWGHLALPSTGHLIFTAFPSASDCELYKVHLVSSCYIYSDAQSSLSRNSAAQPYQSVVMNHLLPPFQQYNNHMTNFEVAWWNDSKSISKILTACRIMKYLLLQCS